MDLQLNGKLALERYRSVDPLNLNTVNLRKAST
jgi:hypothetical protein